MNKGYTEKGFAEKVYHLHIRLPCDHDELYFLSYLQAHPAVAKEYETLKLHLWKRYPHDRDGYRRQRQISSGHIRNGQKENTGTGGNGNR